jgi:dihydrophenazinedicarboxylate synthase
MAAFDDPPADPIALFATWLAEAEACGVREATAVALATVDGGGRPTARTIRILHTTHRGIVFSSHSVSRKGLDTQASGVGAAVIYWPETGRQITMSGRLAITSEDVSDQLWAERSAGTYPMSVATVQSAPLLDEAELRDRAARLMPVADSLPRPATWVGFELMPSEIEFWHIGVDRLHLRLRYDHHDDRWHHSRLQP